MDKQWTEYKNVIQVYLGQATAKSLNAIARQSTTMFNALDKEVVMLTDIANEKIKNQQILAIVITGIILFLVILGRMFGRNV